MAFITKPIKWLLVAATLLLVAWAFFDVGRRYVRHRQLLRERPIELTVMHWGDPAEDKIVADLVAKFEAGHKDVRIVRINAGGDFRNKLKTMMAADIAPDLFYLPPDLLPELAENKQIMELDEQFRNDPNALKDFWPILLDAFRYDVHAGVLGQGPLYGLPKDFTTAVFYANTDLLDQAGVDWRQVQKSGWDWPRFEAEMKKVNALNGRPEYADRKLFGAFFQIWTDSLQTVLWSYDGDYFARKPDGTPDFTKTALGSEESTKALDVIRRMRLVDKTAYNSTGVAKDAGKEFLLGNIACHGPVGCWMIPTYAGIKDFKWDILPVPAGTRRASQMFYNGWTVSSRSKHPKASLDLLTFLCGREGQVQQGRASLAIPALKSVAESDDFLKPPLMSQLDRQQFLDAVPHARLSQMPKQTEFRQMAQDNANLAIEAGRLTIPEAADKLQAQWSRELNAPLRTKTWPAMPWRPVLLSTAVGLVILVVALVIKAKREKLGAIDRRTERAGFLFIAPWLIGFVIFTLGPMVVSLLLSMSQWTGMRPLGDAHFVGLTNFKQLFAYDPLFRQSLTVTAYFVLLGVPISQFAALLIAMLMNQGVKGIAFFRTVYFVPSVVSGAALAVLWLQLFNNDYGIINLALNAVLRPAGLSLTAAALLLLVGGGIGVMLALRRHDRGEAVGVGRGFFTGMAVGVGVVLLVIGLTALVNGWRGPNAPNWFGYDQTTTPPRLDAARWAVPAYVLMGLWGVGGGMLIYLAGLKGINASLYEAARIDGAGPLRQAWNVTLPMLSPLIFYNLVMGIIGSFQIFTQAYIMSGAGPENSTLFYVLNLYRQAFEFHNMGYASAMAWVLFVIVLILTLGVFAGSKKLVFYEGLK